MTLITRFIILNPNDSLTASDWHHQIESRSVHRDQMGN